MNIKIRRLLGTISRAVSPGYSACGRCGVTWNFVEKHVTYYTVSNGCFPLCEHCWQSLSIDERLSYYVDLVLHVWNSPEQWKLVKAAVLEGK